MKNSENFRMHAKTFYGFEAVLAKELSDLGAGNVKTRNRLVEFDGDLGFMYKANYSLSTALRILKPIFSFSAKDEKYLYQRFKNFKWEDYMTPNQTFAIHATVYSDYFTHSQYAALKVKDALVDRFRERFGKRPDVDKDHPDIYFNLHISQNKITLSLDSSGESLHKRGYRVEQGEAPINEVLAAGLLKLAGWEGKGNFLDPMCGSGTIPIESAMMAARIPTQIHRKHFAFENWKDFDRELFDIIKQSRLDRTHSFNGKIKGYDSNLLMCRMANKNVISAGLEEFIEIEQKDFFETKKDLFPVLLVFNPPYNHRIKSDNEQLYAQIGNTLKHSYPDTYAWFITSDLSAKKYVGLRPSKKIKVYNGKLECDFLRYEVYEGSRKD